jgi:mono/diheme cytochrome c family protein
LPPAKLVPRLAIALVTVVAVLFVGVIGVAQARSPDPYAQSVLALVGDPIQGHAIFQVNCAGCHGLTADGSVGPSLKSVSLRKSKAQLITQVIGGKTPPMPKFQPQPQEMADLLSYLENL